MREGLPEQPGQAQGDRMNVLSLPFKGVRTGFRRAPLCAVRTGWLCKASTEIQGGDGVKEVTSPRVIAARNPIPHLTSPLKGEEPGITQDADADAPHLTSPLNAFPYTQLELHKPAL